MRRFVFAACGLLVWVGGCVVVDPQHRDEILGSRDGGGQGDGQVMHDAGGPKFDDRCGEDSPLLVLTETTRDIAIDTTGYENDSHEACGDSTPGPDVFLAVDVVAGAPWHFHLQADTEDRDPMLYLTQQADCDARSCQYVSSTCGAGGAEHFAFDPSAAGRWYLGIDDLESGPGHYTLSAYRLNCGDNTKLHGEGCDDGNMVDGDGCDRHCRYELSSSRSMESEPNDNHIEANSLILPASGELVITGGVAPSDYICTDNDTFAISLADGADLAVDLLQQDLTPCANGSLTPFDLSLENAAGETVLAGMEDSSGCKILQAPDQAGGLYFLRVSLPPTATMASTYRLRVRVTP